MNSVKKNSKIIISKKKVHYNDENGICITKKKKLLTSMKTSDISQEKLLH